MYTHEVVSLGQFTGMRHYRGALQRSGLVALEEIGHTVAISNPAPPLGTTALDSVLLPTIFETIAVTTSRLEAADEVRIMDQIGCDNLDEFVAKGIERWREIAHNRGDVVDIRLHFAENHRTITEKTIPSGLVIPLEDPEIEFIGYVAQPDEMEALEHITIQALNSSASLDNEVPGFYL